MDQVANKVVDEDKLSKGSCPDTCVRAKCRAGAAVAVATAQEGAIRLS